MAQFLAQIAKMLKPLGGQADVLVAVKIHAQAVSVAELRLSQNRIDVITLDSIALLRPVDFKNIARHQDMIADAIRKLKTQAKLTAVDASIAIPCHAIQIRLVNLPYMSVKDLAIDAKDIDFWIESEPDLAKIDDPIVNYQVLVSSEDDDLTRVLLCFAPAAAIKPWIDIILAGHLNPVFVEADSTALINLRQATLEGEERGKAQAIIQISPHGSQCIAFEPGKMQSIKLEISAFDLVLIEEGEDAESLDGEFWDEIAARIANIIKQALLFLQEEQDFQPFAQVHFVSEYSRCAKIIPLLHRHLDIAPLALFDPLKSLAFTEATRASAALHANPSRLASVLGSGLQRLGIYGGIYGGGRHAAVNMLPARKILARNRQLSIIARVLRRGLVASIIVLALWTGGIILPSLIESQRISRDFDNVKASADRITNQLNVLQNTLKTAGLDLEQMRVMTQSSGKVFFMETLADLIPDGVELATLKLTQSDRIELTGYASMSQSILILQNELTASGLMTGIVVETEDSDGLIAFTLGGRLGITE